MLQERGCHQSSPKWKRLNASPDRRRWDDSPLGPLVELLQGLPRSNGSPSEGLVHGYRQGLHRQPQPSGLRSQFRGIAAPGVGGRRPACCRRPRGTICRQFEADPICYSTGFVSDEAPTASGDVRVVGIVCNIAKRGA
jgi:hypothetical protein